MPHPEYRYYRLAAYLVWNTGQAPSRTPLVFSYLFAGLAALLAGLTALRRAGLGSSISSPLARKSAAVPGFTCIRTGCPARLIVTISIFPP